MNVLSERLRQLLARRWERLEHAHRSFAGSDPDRGRNFVESLLDYGRSFEDEPHLRDLAREAERMDEALRLVWRARVDRWLDLLTPAGLRILATNPAALAGDHVFASARTLATLWDQWTQLRTLLLHGLVQPLDGVVERTSGLAELGIDAEAFRAEVLHGCSVYELESRTSPAAGWTALQRFLGAWRWPFDSAWEEIAFSEAGKVLDTHNIPDRPWFDMPPLQRFHDWALDRILAGAAVEAAVQRFARGVERFERDEYRGALIAARPEGTTANLDERLACRKLAAWLHLQGLEPWNEVQLGDGRADVGVPAGPERVAVEAKVIRPGDPERTIRQRLIDGRSQARAYAERMGQSTGYLLVFWLDDTRFHDLRESYRTGDTSVRVVVVDLRSVAPSAVGVVPLVSLPEPTSGATT